MALARNPNKIVAVMNRRGGWGRVTSVKTRWMRAARVASAAAFVLCLALCVGSFFVVVYRSTPIGGGQVRTDFLGAGGIHCNLSTPTHNPPTGGWVVHTLPRPEFIFFLRYPGWSRDGPRLNLPFWIPLCAFGVLPSVGIVGRWRERRRASRVGRCARCGYDLRATPERCPECGTACGAGGGGN